MKSYLFVDYENKCQSFVREGVPIIEEIWGEHPPVRVFFYHSYEPWSRQVPEMLREKAWLEERRVPLGRYTRCIYLKLLIFSIVYSMYLPQAQPQPHSKKDFEDFVKRVAYSWAQEHGSHIDDQGIDLYGERDWSRPYGWTFLSHTVSIGSGRKVGNSTQQADMVVQFQGENPLEDKDVTKTVTYTNTYSDKSHWTLREGFKGGWSKGSAVPGIGWEVNFESTQGSEESTMRTVTVMDPYIIPPRHKLKVTSVVRSEVTNWVFDVAVTVQGGVALNFNPPVALGPDPDDKHHYWWTEIGNVVRCGQDGGYGPPFMDRAEKHDDFVTYRGRLELQKVKTLTITTRPDYFDWEGRPIHNAMNAPIKPPSACYVMPGGGN